MGQNERETPAVFLPGGCRELLGHRNSGKVEERDGDHSSYGNNGNSTLV